MYDNEDSVCGIIFNNRPFYFVKNLQGDVIAITDDGANIVARYTYDAWGVPTIVQDTTYTDYNNFETAYNFNIAEINPYRYRSYYYDTEIGCYYLQSRYYNPSIGRFINADEFLLLGINEDFASYDVFTYCSNNPINYCDYCGYLNVFAPKYPNTSIRSDSKSAPTDIMKQIIDAGFGYGRKKKFMITGYTHFYEFKKSVDTYKVYVFKVFEPSWLDKKPIGYETHYYFRLYVNKKKYKSLMEQYNLFNTALNALENVPSSGDFTGIRDYWAKKLDWFYLASVITTYLLKAQLSYLTKEINKYMKGNPTLDYAVTYLVSGNSKYYYDKKYA